LVLTKDKVTQCLQSTAASSRALSLDHPIAVLV